MTDSLRDDPPSGSCPQLFDQPDQSPGPVADEAFFSLGIVTRRWSRSSSGQKERIVSEPSAPRRSVSRVPSQAPAKESSPSPTRASTQRKRHPRSDWGTSRISASTLSLLASSLPSPSPHSGRKSSPWLHFHGIDLDPAVIGEKPAFAGSDRTQSVSLEQGVGFEGGTGLPRPRASLRSHPVRTLRWRAPPDRVRSAIHEV